jgi:hypothetical protein
MINDTQTIIGRSYQECSNSENQNYTTTKHCFPQSNQDQSSLHYEINSLSNRLVSVSANDTSLSILPYVKLSNGILVTDYTADKDFVARLEAMPYAEVEKLSNQIKQYPDEFPMPCMAITAKQIHESINKLLKQHNLTAEEQQDFISLQQELIALAPQYPYKQSLIFVYKFLLCKSFIEYRFQTQAVDIYKSINQQCSLLVTDVIAVRRISNFKKNCSLKKILKLPWGNMLEIDKNFGDELIKIYSGIAVSYQDYDDGKASRYPFSLEVALIPCTDELTIANLNKTWGLPTVWLVGCSTAETINADSFNMSSSGFFEHDLFHLSMRIDKINQQEIYQEVLNWVKNIYQNKSILESISAFKFAAVELAIFLIAHEDVEIGKCSSIKQALINLSVYTERGELYDLPLEYADITYYDIRIAAKCLSYLPTEDYTDKEFSQAALELKEKIHCIDFNDIPLSKYSNTVRVVKELPQAINEVIEDVKNNMANIEQQGFNCSCIVANLRLYHFKHRFNKSDSLYPQFIDKNIFLNEALFEKEAKFTIEKYNSLIFV